MNRRTSLSALVGLSVLLTSLAATASPPPQKAPQQEGQELVGMFVTHMVSIKEGFGSEMRAFVAKQKEELEMLEAQVSHSGGVHYKFVKNEREIVSDLRVTPEHFMESYDGGAFRAMDLFVFQESGQHLDGRNILQAKIRRDITHVQVLITLLVPENRVDEAQALYRHKSVTGPRERS